MNNEKLLLLIRTFLLKSNRYYASSTHARLKEMQQAQVELERELEKWPKAVENEPHKLF